jgi:hypothetical protein
MEQVIADHFPQLRASQQKGLGLWVYGTILAGSACQNAGCTPDLPSTKVGLAWYSLRIWVERWIDQLKTTCFADRLSCCDFWPNQFRLLLSAATYWLLHTVRSWLEHATIAPMRLETFRLTLLKIGARVFEFPTHLRLRLASSHPGQTL